MEEPADRIHDQAGNLSNAAWLLCALVFCLAAWATVGWAVHLLVA